MAENRGGSESTDRRRQRARDRVLRQAIADLTAEVRDLQAQVAALADARDGTVDRAARESTRVGSSAVQPQPAGVSAALKRFGKAVVRSTLGAARRLWQASDPAQRYVVARRSVPETVASLPTLTVVVEPGGGPDTDGLARELRRQTAAPLEVAFWDRQAGAVELRRADEGAPRRAAARTGEELRESLGGDFVVDLPARVDDLPSTLLESLQWLLASEQLCYARALVGPVEEDDGLSHELLACSRPLWGPGGVDLDRLAAAAAKRPVVGKTVGLAGRLDDAVPRLAPLGPGSREVVCRTGRYDVWAGNRAGPVLHAVRRLPGLPAGDAAAAETMLMVIASPLVGGSASVVSAATRSLRNRARVVVASTAADCRLTVVRALALERLGATVYEIGTLLEAEVWQSAIARIADRCRPAGALVLGRDTRLDAVLAYLRGSGVRVMALADDDSRPLDEIDLLLVEDGPEGAPPNRGGADHTTRVAVPAGWAVPDWAVEVPRERRARVRAELGIPADRWTVVTAVDLVPAGRPEDVVVVADRLRDADVDLLLVGDGPLAGTVVDLIGFLGVRNLHLRRQVHPLGELVLAADLVLDPSEEPVVRPLVVAALAAGVPVVTAPGGGAERLISEAGGGAVVRSAGDPDALAEAVRAARSGALRPDSQAARRTLRLRQQSGEEAVLGALLGPSTNPSPGA